MLVLSRRRGESVQIGAGVIVTVLAVGGGRVKIGVSAPAEIEVWRTELKDGAGLSRPTKGAATCASATPAPRATQGNPFSGNGARP
jgi:carbon storage regulator CsrA